MTIKTDKVLVENGADFTFVCRKIPFAISCSELHQGGMNLIDLDLVNKMKIPVRNIRVTRMSLLGHDVRAVGRIKQTVQCVVNGRPQGNTHLEGKVVRDLYASVETNLFFERIRISNLIRNLEIFRIRIRILFVVRKFSNPNPNIRDSGKKIRIRIRI